MKQYISNNFYSSSIPEKKTILTGLRSFASHRGQVANSGPGPHVAHRTCGMKVFSQ